jgi:hypothetical protein
MSIARVKYRKYKYIYKEKHKIQLKNKKNYNDHMRIYSINTVIIHRQKHNILPESKTYIAQNMKKL